MNRHKTMVVLQVGLVALLGLFATAQPLTTMKITNQYPAISAAGIRIFSLTDPAAAPMVSKIVGNDLGLLAPILPYSVLVVNNSQQSLQVISLFFSWNNPTNSPTPQGGLTLVQMRDTPPGGAELVTPHQTINRFLVGTQAQRAAALQGSGGIGPQLPAGGFATLIQDEAANYAAVSNFSVRLDAVALNNQWLGSDHAFAAVQAHMPQLHK